MAMTETDWRTKAGKLHTACLNEIGKNNKSGRLTAAQTTSLNELQHAVGSHHGKHSVSYQEAWQSLDDMFKLVKAGKKTPPLLKG